jgi:lipopolysaccharide export system permease protein
MRILDKYILREISIPIIFCLYTLVFLFLIADLFDHLSEIMSNTPPLKDIILYYLNLLPFAFVQMIPWSTFLGTLFLFFNFTRHNEIIAMKACGLKMTKIAAPVLFLGLILSVITFVVNDRLVPQTFKAAEKILTQKIQFSTDTTDTVFNETLTNTTLLSNNKQYFIRFFDPETKIIEDIRIHFLDSNNRVKEKITAERGVWIDNKWSFSDVSVHQLDPSGRIIGKPEVFKTKSFDTITETPHDFIEASLDSAYLNSKELQKYIDRLKENELNTTAARTELHYKWAFPWQCLVIILFTVPFLSRTGNIRRGMVKNIIVCLLIVGAYHIATATFVALGQSGVMYPFISAWLANIIFAIGGLLFFEHANH